MRSRRLCTITYETAKPRARQAAIEVVDERHTGTHRDLLARGHESQAGLR